jgi:hypothetical protein
MEPAFFHWDLKVWWCKFCSEMFLEEAGRLFLLNPTREAQERLARLHAGRQAM